MRLRSERAGDRRRIDRRAMTSTLAGLALVSSLVVGCDSFCGDQECRFTEEEWAVINTLSPLPDVEPDPTNKYWNDDGAAELGQKFFHERRYSSAVNVELDPSTGVVGQGPDSAGLISCSACHDPKNWFIDRRSKPGNVSIGVEFTQRNASTAINSAYYKFYGWGGKEDSLWSQASFSPENTSDSAGNRCRYARIIWDHYRDEYNAVFDEKLPTALDPNAPDAARFPAECKPKEVDTPDGAWERMTPADRDAVNRIMANQGKAVAAYEMRLVSRESPFDLYVGGDGTSLTEEAKRGLKLFVGKAACIDCHNGAHFSDGKFHNLGVPQAGPNVPEVDDGRFTDISKLKTQPFNSKSPYRDGPDPLKWSDNLEAEDRDKGTFRTPSLRNVAMTSPYMHNGYLETLRDVVEFYNEGGETSGFVGQKSPALVPLNLSASEIDNLLAFLESLTGEPIPDELTRNPLEND